MNLNPNKTPIVSINPAQAKSIQYLETLNV